MNRLLIVSIALVSKMIGKTRKADPNVWVFGEWFGKKCSDNCAYFANYVARVNTNIKIH